LSQIYSRAFVFLKLVIFNLVFIVEKYMLCSLCR